MNSNQTFKIKVKKIEKPSYVIDKSKLRRFNGKNRIFERLMWDSSWEGHKRMYDGNMLNVVAEGKPGYSRVDYALRYASRTVHDAFEGGFAHTKIKHYSGGRFNEGGGDAIGTAGIDWTKTKYKVDDSHKMRVYIKRAAKLFGASLVGICKLNRDWLYADVDIPQKFKNAIVIAVEMDADAIATAPAIPAWAAAGVGYSKMAFILACTGEFIRNLGYEGIQCGNDIALSIPLAIDAGLGELGRNGLLITPQYGPRVRLCKIFTDLPLEPDKPIEFDVKNFCKKCKLCAKHCEAGAISMDDEPSFEVVCRSNNPGALKWYLDAERCWLFCWKKGTGCGICIKVCPYNIASADKVNLSAKEFWESKD